MTVAQAGDLCWALVWIVTLATPFLVILVLVKYYRRQPLPRPFLRTVLFGIVAVPAATYVIWLAAMIATIPLHKALAAPIVHNALQQQFGIMDDEIVARGHMRSYLDDLWWTWTSADGTISCGTWMYFFATGNNELPLECYRAR